MAKITARGAHEVARTKKVAGRGQFLMRSDGVVLYHSGVAGDGWQAWLRLTGHKGWTDQDLARWLRKYAEETGLEVQ